MHDSDEFDPTSGPPAAERIERLVAGAEALSRRRGSVSSQRVLLSISAVAMTTGLSAIGLAWLGASRTNHLEEQVPYLISGGLFGVALAIIGALVLFTNWLTLLVREIRSQERARRTDHEAMMVVLETIAGALTNGEVVNGTARGARTQRPLRGASRSS